MRRGNFRKRKFNRKRKSTYKIFFLVLVGMTVGFAAINTTLQLIGTLNIAKTTWNIHWENPTKTGGVTATTDVHLKQNDNTTVEYSVNLANQGDYYEFTVDAKNEGTIDAMITGIENKVYENNVEIQKPDYLDFIVTYSNGMAIDFDQKLSAGNSETYKVKVMYKTGLTADQLPTSNRNLKFTFKVTYMQADENAKNRLIALPTGKTKDNLEVGDEICILDQCFNFLHYDGTNNEDIVMLSKYNLKVGNIYDSSWNKTGEYTSSDPEYGKQSSEARGYVSGASSYNGAVAFSATNYWYDERSYPTDVYDAVNYKTEPDFSTTCNNSTNCWDTPGYSVAYYVDNYKTILTGYGVTIKDARLLKYFEATDSSIGCSYSAGCPTDSFITNTSFWLGSASKDDAVWRVRSGGSFDYSSFNFNIYLGVRPVIVISKSDI